MYKKELKRKPWVAKLLFFFIIGIILLLFLLLTCRALRWSQNDTSVPSGSQYAPRKNYGFQVNWTDYHASVSSVSFEANFSGSMSNYTRRFDGTKDWTEFYNDSSGMWWINFTQEQFKGAGLYVYRWYANDTKQAWNTTDQWIYVIAKNATNPVALALNNTRGNRNITYSNGNNATGWLLYSQSGSVSLWRNKTSIRNPDFSVYSIGFYMFKANTSGNENYSANATGEQWNLTVRSTLGGGSPAPAYYPSSSGSSPPTVTLPHCSPPTSGDWNITATDDITCMNQNDIISGSVTIYGKLTLVNATLQMNNTEMGIRNITVYNGGRFYAYSGSNITSENKTFVNTSVLMIKYSAGSIGEIRNSIIDTIGYLDTYGINIYNITRFNFTNNNVIYVNNTPFTGSVIGGSGVYLIGSNYSNISFNNFTVPDVGVWGDTGSNNYYAMIYNNTFNRGTFNNPEAISMRYGGHNIMTNNTLIDMGGIDSEMEVNDTITYNNISCRGNCITVASNNSTVMHNNLTGSLWNSVVSGIYITGGNVWNITVDDNTVKNFNGTNLFINPSAGIRINYNMGQSLPPGSYNVIIRNNHVSKSNYGIYQDEQVNNTLIYNNVVINNTNGTYFFMYNNIQPSFNLIYNNIIANNTVNANDTGYSNWWNTTNQTGPNIIGGPYIGGNYYSDYSGTDGNGDGFGDTPYSIATNGTDYLPLV